LSARKIERTQSLAALAPAVVERGGEIEAHRVDQGDGIARAGVAREHTGAGSLKPRAADVAREFARYGAIYH
jgi:hypothetical protein